MMPDTIARRTSWPIVGLATLIVGAAALHAQGGRSDPGSPNLQEASAAMREGRGPAALAAVHKELVADPTSPTAASLLDSLGETTEARAVWARVVAAATTPQAKADAERSLAMSYAFNGDCPNTVKYEQMVISYWASRETAEPQNAFYEEGEIANEAARVCLDAGDLTAAEKWYRTGTELGLKEPGNQTHPKSLWDYRLAHALGRLAARRGDATEAKRQVAAARHLLDGDPAMAAQQERFYPYLVGYVALYTNDLKTAETELATAVTATGNQGDPFMECLLAMTYDKEGHHAQAQEAYRKAFGLALQHNPPSAFTRSYARTKLGFSVPS
jgi:Flp pilus assembly protein TadD